jgi:2-polyprenyl-3-methyl-5-hydroxy-6-metoxy-1,4-benzoquinol methylase
VAEYWNHNTAYHPWLMKIAARHHGDVLDVGCGDGLLVQRLAAVSRRVVGIDPDAGAIQRAENRIHGIDNTSVVPTTFRDFTASDASFDVVIFVASIHHQQFPEALGKARQLLRRGGDLAVVGLAANKSVTDWAWEVMRTPAAWALSRLHREVSDLGFPVAQPTDNIDEIRRIVGEVLPHAKVRRGLYYRYRLHWRKL